ncbi:hypothetical protein JCM10213_005227 [Rhodosporidiobolus nylandii]
MAGGGGVSSHLTSVLCWTFLPSLLTNAVLSVFYKALPSVRPTVPPHATPQQLSLANARAQSHHRRARIFLLSAYLVYSVASVYHAQGSTLNANYYALLGLPREVVDRDGASVVKKHFKRLARVYHPDKIGKDGEALFVEIKRGVDVLQDDGKRWAYERFGPGVTSWGGGKLVTNREFLKAGALHSLVFWASAMLSIVAFTFFRKSERRYNFWRYLTLFLSLALEMHLLLRPSPSPTFSLLFPARLTYEHISLLRQLFISASMAMSQLAPLLFPPPPSEGTPEDAYAAALADAEQLKPALARLARLTAVAEAEASALQELEMRPLLVGASPAPSSPAEAKQLEGRIRRDLQDQMVRTFEDLQVKSSPATAGVWREAIAEGRKREKKERKGKKDGRGEKRRKKKAKEPEEADAANSPPTVDSAAPTVPTAASLEPVVIPPPVTALASPPDSPTLGFPNSAILLPSPDVAVGNGSASMEEDAVKPVEQEKGETTKEQDSRLPTPPPE